MIIFNSRKDLLMDDNLTWTEVIIDEAVQKADNYATIALLKKIKAEIAETDKRIAQAQGKLDGISWDHEEW
ncbi:hypothetical protein [Aerococcus sp. 1KP-2016]|uniref:hypothetical protein n=1 Tax=Aerococcus sp. 1KP-2016 TaxID=1981982 RepID=UPI000B99A48F|nr:hypothetical protein [Aerococcus sp. 1KP-2016]OYQ66709.1 hypothetical protein B9P78_05645 [Aerococcus sp. 1KP-2016]